VNGTLKIQVTRMNELAMMSSNLFISALIILVLIIL